MAALSYQRIALSGVGPTFAAASAGGDTVQGHPHGFIYVKNGSAGAVTVTIPTPGKTRFDVDEPDITVSVPASGERVIGPLDPALTDPTDKAVKITYSAVASVTVAALAV